LRVPSSTAQLAKMIAAIAPRLFMADPRLGRIAGPAEAG